MKEHDATCYSPDLSEAKAVDMLIESMLEGHHVGVVASLASIMDGSTCFLM
jgi:hypothetical protein